MNSCTYNNIDESGRHDNEQQKSQRMCASLYVKYKSRQDQFMLRVQIVESCGGQKY